MPNASQFDSLISQDDWAEVRGRSQVVRYRRSGVGHAVLLLHARADDQPLWPELLDVLRSGFRLIVPNPPAEHVAVEAWLSVLLDGLGVSNVTVIASDGCCVAALDRVHLEPEQIARVVLVCGDRLDQPALEATARLSTIPILVLHRDSSAAEAVPLITGFLVGDEGARRS